MYYYAPDKSSGISVALSEPSWRYLEIFSTQFLVLEADCAIRSHTSAGGLEGKHMRTWEQFTFPICADLGLLPSLLNSTTTQRLFRHDWDIKTTQTFQLFGLNTRIVFSWSFPDADASGKIYTKYIYKYIQNILKVSPPKALGFGLNSTSVSLTAYLKYTKKTTRS